MQHTGPHLCLVTFQCWGDWTARNWHHQKKKMFTTCCFSDNPLISRGLTSYKKTIVFSTLYQPLSTVASKPTSSSVLLKTALRRNRQKKLPYCLKHSWKSENRRMFWNTFRSMVFFSATLIIHTSLSVHILKLANEKENRALLICLSYGKQFSASKVMLSRKGSMSRVKHQTNMHSTWQVLFWPGAFSVNFLNSTQWDLKKTSAQHTSSTVLLSSLGNSWMSCLCCSCTCFFIFIYN